MVGLLFSFKKSGVKRENRRRKRGRRRKKKKNREEKGDKGQRNLAGFVFGRGADFVTVLAGKPKRRGRGKGEVTKGLVGGEKERKEIRKGGREKWVPRKR